MNVERTRNWILETPRNSTDWQAFVMVEYTGIKEYTSGQRDLYFRCRQGVPPEELSMPLALSDQEVFDIGLTKGERLIFRSHYPGIIFSSE